MATEQPSYRVATKFDDFEIREYAPYVVAETEVSGTRESAGNAGFRILAAYIFGKNRGERKIAMTAPVAQAEGRKIAMTAPVAQAQGAPGSFVVRFGMPARFTLATLPEPLDPARLAALDARFRFDALVLAAPDRDAAAEEGLRRLAPRTDVAADRATWALVAFDDGGLLYLRRDGRYAERAARDLGVDAVHLTLTHDGGVAAAAVVLESRGARAGAP